MKKYLDPYTGDELSRAEWISWHIQVVIRRWTFFVVFAIITAICWLIDNSHILLWWNLCASALAIFVENAVGIAQWSQTRRDAQIIREIRELIQEVRNLAHTDATHSEADYQVDVDSNQRIYEISEVIKDIQEALEIEPRWGEYNYED
jgi:hypothetical protein